MMMTIEDYIKKRESEIRELEENFRDVHVRIFHLGQSLELLFLEQAIMRGEITDK